MVAGFLVSGFCQMRQCPHTDQLCQIIFRHAPGNFGFQPGVLICQPVTRGFKFQVSMNTGQHDLGQDRFGNVVDRAEPESAQLVLLAIECRYENNRDIARDASGFELLQYLITIHVGHHDVQQNQCWQWILTGQLQSPGAGVGDLDLVIRPQ